MEQAILKTVAYADVFDYPLTGEEIHRFLVRRPASLSAVQDVLRNGRLVPGRLSRRQGYFTLPGREPIVETRQRRAAVSARLWLPALHYGTWIGHLPFARMAAVTGALSVDNVEPDADIDLLIVTAPHRLWLCRALAILVVHWAARRGVVICPNYLVTERALAFPEQTLYTAHEVAQMVPITGRSVYRRMCDANAWVAAFLPNAPFPPREVSTHPPLWRPLAQAAEIALRSPLGSLMERWEMSRKMRKLGQEGYGGDESAFSTDFCKGHFGGHGQRTMGAFAARLRDLEEDA